LYQKKLSIALFLYAVFISGQAMAYDGETAQRGINTCPHEYWNQPYVMSNGTVIDDPNVLNRTMDEEFGTGTQEITHCLKKRKNAKVVVSINGAHPSNKAGVVQTDRARFLSNIEYMRENYEDLHGMKMGKEVKVVAVANSSGALLMTTHHPAWMRDKTDVNDPDCPMKPVEGKTCFNPFRHLVERAQEIGVKFYLCQTASRVIGIKKAFKIEGVEYVPGGHIAVADLQMLGYALIDL